MTKVSEIMIKDLVCCGPEAEVENSRDIMKKYSCTKIPVVDKNKMIIGGLALCDLKEGAHMVIECMSKKIRAVEEDSTVDECLKIMIMNNLDQVPVIDKQGHFCGIVTEKVLLGK